MVKGGTVSMFKIVFLINEKQDFARLAQGFRKVPDCSMEWAESIEEVVKKITAHFSGLVIVDEKVNGFSNLEIARQMVLANPMIHLALVSSLSHDAFHEASEGLGLMDQLPLQPDKGQADNLLQGLMDLKNLMGSASVRRS